MQINCNKFDILNTHITHNQKQKNNRVREGRNIKIEASHYRHRHWRRTQMLKRFPAAYFLLTLLSSFSLFHDQNDLQIRVPTPPRF